MRVAFLLVAALLCTHAGLAADTTATGRAPDKRSITTSAPLPWHTFLAQQAGAADTVVSAPRLGREEALADLEAFSMRLRDEAAYLELRQGRPFEAVENLKQRLGATISVADFTRELQRILSPLGDCHSSVSSTALDNEPGLWLPFRLAIAKGGVIAVTRDNSSFVEPEFPYLVAMDGQPLQTWLNAALKYVPVGSATQNLYQSVKGIRRLDVLRRDLGIAAGDRVELTFANAQGQRKVVVLPCRGSFSNLARIRLGDSRKIGDIGYLRLPQMDDELIPEAKRRMEEFRDTSGLIIDLRGNGGGRYGLMRTLFGYFRPADAPPFVCNIAAYRLAERFQENHIEYRPTHRRNWSGWSQPDLAAIDLAMQTFQPSFTLAAGQFSDWHFMLLKQEAFQYHYDKPVIVLCDESCISAADGFLSAFAELPNVRLMGVSSRGGSGSARTVALPQSGIAVRLSTMASFRPNGDTFDGHGVSVDIEAQPRTDDYITTKDSVLEQALRRLKSPAQQRTPAANPVSLNCRAGWTGATPPSASQAVRKSGTAAAFQRRGVQVSVLGSKW